MSRPGTLARRALLATPALLAFANASAPAQDGGSTRMKGLRTLVAYLSRSGNTRVIAETLHRKLNADLFEIRPARPYPADYEEHVAQATRERDTGYEPPLAAKVDDITKYDEILLGFPIWGETAPAPIRSFLKAHDLGGKTLRPFITHGGYGVGESLSVLLNECLRGERSQTELRRGRPASAADVGALRPVFLHSLRASPPACG
jgi:flavodoxin